MGASAAVPVVQREPNTHEHAAAKVAMEGMKIKGWTSEEMMAYVSQDDSLPHIVASDKELATWHARRGIVLDGCLIRSIIRRKLAH